MKDLLASHALVGAIMKAHREELDQSQRDVAMKLGYRNVNFISMIENGRSNVPADRILDIVKAYEFDNDLLIAFFKLLHPQSWKLMLDILKVRPDLSRLSAEGIDKIADDIIDAMIKKYGLRWVTGETAPA
jgi:transcriptional regulator with XRE-family HTH domain